jgi:transcription antitermination protein NusB
MMAVPVRRRTRARELSLQFLYAYEMRGAEAMSELEAFIEHHTKTGEDHTVEGTPRDRQEIADYAHKICLGVHDNLQDLNNWIEHIARNWRLERMAYIDRNVLRIALFELLHETEVPFKVVINEAIDIAKRYSTGQSGSFVNGILDRARVLIQDAQKQSQGGIAAPPSVVITEPEEMSDASQKRVMTTDHLTEVQSPRPTHRRPSASGAGDDPLTDDDQSVSDLRPEDDERSESADLHADEDVPAPSEYPNMQGDIEPSLIPRPRRRRVRRRPSMPERPSEHPSEDS